MKTKKLVALLLSLAVMIASFTLLGVSVSAVDVQTQINIPDGKETYELDGVTYTVINSVEEMNTYAATGGMNFILNADLDYTGKEYKQISLEGGSLNGNGHSITGVHIELASSNVRSISMFYNANGTKKLSNLTIGAPDDYVSVTATGKATATNGKDTIGTLWAYPQGTTTIENVTVYSNVVAPNDFRAGGILGDSRGTITMKNCTFYGSVTVNTTAENKAIAAGGLIAHSNGSGTHITLENCANYGSISCPDTFAGGLIGGADRYFTITNCANYGEVSGKWSGGLIADAGTNCYSQITMNNCFNAGKVTGTEGAAGLIYNCVRRTDNWFTNLKDCANIGEVISDNKADFIYSHGTDTSKGSNHIELITMENCGSFGTTFALVNKEASNTNIAGNSTTIEAAAALKFMQDNFGFAMFGIEGGKIVVKTVPVETKFLQYKKDAEAGKMDIRVLGAIYEEDLSKYANVGFNVSVYKTGVAEALGTFSEKTNVVYESVFANDDGTITEYSADSLGVTYLYALELQNISMSGSYTFEITAFATDANNPDTIVSDITVTISIVDGVIQ